MILNLLILIFLVLMAYWWGWLQGLFSSFLNLCVVIVAGALAIALWEPVAFLLLSTSSVATPHAWGISLLGLAVAFILILRLAMDKLIPANVQFHQLVNIFVGGFFGLLTGILLSGLTLLGVGFLPLAPDILGYQPLLVDSSTGQVKPNTASTLLFPVDQWTADFYQSLSAGPFYGGSPLDVYRDNLATQSALFRLRETFDPNLSTVAVPQSVSVLSHLQHAPKLPDLAGNIQKIIQQAVGSNSDSRLIFIDTQWVAAQGTFDTDGALRIAPTQVRLTVQKSDQANAPAQALAPVAVSVLDQNSKGGKRRFVPLNNESNFAKLIGNKGQLGWLFVLPTDLSPRFILLRQLRLSLPETRDVPTSEFISALGSIDTPTTQPPGTPGSTPGSPAPGTPAPGSTPGTPTPAAPGTPAPAPATPTPAAPGTPGTSTGASPSGVVSSPTITRPGPAAAVTSEVEVTAMLPQPISRNMASGFQYQGQEILAGSSSVNKSSFSLSQETRVDRFAVPSHQVMVRLKITRERGQSIFGRAVSSAKMLQAIWIDDGSDDPNLPVAFVRYRPSDGSQQIRIDRLTPLISARQTPIAEMQDNDELYVYFLVSKGARVTAYHLGKDVTQILSIDIPR